MAAVEVFVDDAVLGRLPGVCAKTGVPADGKLRIEQSLGDLGWKWLLLLLGPGGWVVLVILLLMSSGRGVLTVRLPYSQAAVDREMRVGYTRRIALVGCIGFAILAVFFRSLLVLPEVCTAAAIVAGAVAVVMHVRLRWNQVRVRLDASRRWVTLSHVHPAFARAVAELGKRSSV